MNPTELYQQIAETYHSQGKFQERDRFLVLALDAAQSSGHGNTAEQIRQRLLELNPNHLIKPYNNIAAAMQAPNFIAYVSQLRKNFPPAKAQVLLQELGGALPVRPKRTMLADSTFPTAMPADDPKTPTWSQLQIETKPRGNTGPSIGIYNVAEEPRMTPANDPLANVPVTSTQPTVPFNLEQPVRRAPEPTRQPEIVPAPRQASSRGADSAAGVWVGNLLFIILFLASVATLCYVFVLPFYPEVAKMLK
ncbi:MAG TPA: hypothetical protein PLN21_02195 [Gemmatales bacterium]|nr:hypothetical protein [Gemmatales bacterium]